MPHRTMDIRFPFAGVVRRPGYRDGADQKPPFPAPWAVNIRPVDPLARRLRGGSRPGLTAYAGASVGSGTAGLASIKVASESGTDEHLVRVADAGAVLVCGQQYVYSIVGGAITKIDPKTGGTAGLAASAGTLPSGATLGAIYCDRLFLAGADNAIHPSAVGDYTNWDTSLDVSRTTRALPPLQLSGAAEVGAAPTALVPFGDASLLLATAKALWVMRGDPGASEGLLEVSRHVGILGPRSWCRIGGEAVFLSGDGLYLCSADGSNLADLSGDRLPVDLRDIDATVLLGYDHEWGGVHIYVDGGTHWFFHLATKSFWVQALQSDHEPTAVCEHGGQLILGGSDEDLRYVGGSDDDGTDIESHLLIGPVRPWKSHGFGRLAALHGTLGAQSDDVTWRLVLGDTAYEAAENAKTAVELYQADDSDYENYVFSSGTWDAGRAHVVYPRCRAMWVVLWLQSDGRWAYENVAFEATPSGRWR